MQFLTEDGNAEISLAFSQMTAMFVGEAPADDPLIGLLKSGSAVEIRDQAGVYPARTYSLAGSSASIDTPLQARR